ncbi:MAG TPA: TetR/AcrR family transcriptional regulator C-terminal domain-containing protein [Actinoplanes sp.]|nr:TetR/AcrR family transcriptional regulator C-terminal domain-containing protein [Actinoplanes sp.]
MENQDVDRTLTLLWRRTLGAPQGSRGPKQRVSVDEVVRAAVAVADEEGLPAFSMRKVADRLGLKLMSIYTYVPGRSELIGLMIDEVGGEVKLPPHTGDLRERITAMARQVWDEYHRHPWLLQVEDHRPWIGPNGSDKFEWQLAAIEGAGFTDLEMDQVITLVTGFAASAARASVAARRAAAQTGMSDAEWWEINAPILQRVMPGGAYPISSRVGQAAGQEYNAINDPDRSFQFGLDRIIDGLADLLDR